MSDQDDDEKREGREAAVLGGCEHALVVQEQDGVTKRLTPVHEGQAVPPGTELVAIKRGPRAGTVRLLSLHSGPPKVATKRYRDGWDTVFGKKRQLDPTLN